MTSALQAWLTMQAALQRLPAVAGEEGVTLTPAAMMTRAMHDPECQRIEQSAGDRGVAVEGYSFGGSSSPPAAITAEDDGAVRVRVWGRIYSPAFFRWEVDPMDVARQLEARDPRPTSIVLDLASPGGEYFPALGLFAALRRWENRGVPVTAEVSGLAASAAALLFMAGGARLVRPESVIMLHEVRGLLVAYGPESAGEEAFDAWRNAIGAGNRSMIAALADRGGMDAGHAAELLAAETWLVGEEAVAEGVATATEPDAGDPDAPAVDPEGDDGGGSSEGDPDLNPIIGDLDVLLAVDPPPAADEVGEEEQAALEAVFQDVLGLLEVDAPAD